MNHGGQSLHIRRLRDGRALGKVEIAAAWRQKQKFGKLFSEL
jgi:hypothetical protein